jgi:endoglucanase
MNENEHSLSFLKQLLGTPGPSGDETAAARVWRSEARSFADGVSADVHGNSYALLQGEGPRILLTGHIDEIGLMVSYIDDDGFLSFDTIGGWDPQVLVGQRVRLLGRQGELVGVIGKKPIHLLKSEQRAQSSQIEGMWIDIGASSRSEVLEQVQVGAVAVIDAPVYELAQRRIVSRSLDNRIGAFIVLEVLRLLAQDRPPVQVAAVATTHEETGAAGAAVAAFRSDPHVALVVDVTWATDHPQSSKQQDGDVKLGGGPVLSRGAANSPLVYARLLEIAEREGIPYSLQITPRRTGTDADTIYRARAGVATGLISVPTRYMHSPNEMVDLADVEQIVRLIAAFVRSVGSEREFIPE